MSSLDKKYLKNLIIDLKEENGDIVFVTIEKAW